jgi:hypothetical protein
MSRRASADEASPATTSPANVLFLPVFLVLLVFFIVLTAQSVPKRDKVDAVMTSLEKRFPPFVIDRRLQGGEAALASRAGTVFAAERLDGMGRLFSTMIAVAEVDKVTPGRVMEVRLPADSLFIPGAVWLRKERQALLERVATAMRADLPGERLELEALLSIDPDQTGQGPGPVARAGALARALAELGVPPRALSVGVERGAPGGARLRFIVRDARIGGDGGENDHPGGRP